MKIQRYGYGISQSQDEGDLHRLAQLQQFVDVIHGNCEPEFTCDDARATLLVCEAARQSIERGQVAHLMDGERYEF